MVKPALRVIDICMLIQLSDVEQEQIQNPVAFITILGNKPITIIGFQILRILSENKLLIER